MADEQKPQREEEEPEKEDKAHEELSDEQLDKVVGGAEIISPRDPASGLPTGKRS